MIDRAKQAANRLAREEKKKEHLRTIHSGYVAQFRASAGNEPVSVARQVHGAIENVLARDRGNDPASRAIRCARRCSHCCREPVEIFAQEAALLVEAARTGGFELDTARLERQSRYDISRWHGQPQADRACVFLGVDGACRVYSDRPNACRKLLVVTEPELCDRERHGPASAGRWISWEAELLASAALEAHGTALMPVALLGALKSAG